jgi:hypothetical protein
LISFRSGGPSDHLLSSSAYRISSAPKAARYLVAATLLLVAVGLPLQPPVKTAQAGPASQVSDLGPGRFYPETGYTLAAQFVDFYDRNGSLPIFGYPVSDARMENGFLVQWTERQRLEWHPEQVGTEFEVQLGLLGRELTHGLNGPSFREATSETEETHYFSQTGQYVDDLFYDYWVRNGGLRVFGYPISAEVPSSEYRVPNGSDDTHYSVQWFERARFEVHPADQHAESSMQNAGLTPTAYCLLPTAHCIVLLGHLGYEALKARSLADYKFQVYPAQSSAGSCCPIQQTSAPESTLQIGLAQGGESDDPGFFDNIKDAGSALGPGLVRLDNIFNFYNIVQRGPDGTISYHWEQLDRELDAVHAMNKEPLITLSYMPETMSVTRNSRVMPPANYGEWAALVRAVVTHINIDRCGGTASASCPNRVTYWEVWNEPNLWSFWQAPFPDYLKLYDVTVQAAITADPTIKIGGPAVSYFSTDHLGDFLEHERWQVLQGATARLDFISWHSYGRSAEQVAADIRQMRKILEGYPQFNPQLFITEFNVLQGGAGDTSDMGYTDTVEGAIAFLSSIESMQRERLDRALLFELKDGQGASSYWGRWGILTYDGKPKPIYYALKAVQNRPHDMMPVSLLSGHEDEGRMESGGDGSLGMMVFGTPGMATLLLWYTGPTEARVKVALPHDFDATDFDVALFDHDNNNPARASTGITNYELQITSAPSNSSFVIRNSSIVNSGDLLFELKPYSLVIMTSR